MAIYLKSRNLRNNENYYNGMPEEISNDRFQVDGCKVLTNINSISDITRNVNL